MREPASEPGISALVRAFAPIAFEREKTFRAALATHAPMCTLGPSRPNGIVAVMTRHTPVARQKKVFHWNNPCCRFPLRYPLSSGMPLPRAIAAPSVGCNTPNAAPPTAATAQKAYAAHAAPKPERRRTARAHANLCAVKRAVTVVIAQSTNPAPRPLRSVAESLPNPATLARYRASSARRRAKASRSHRERSVAASLLVDRSFGRSSHSTASDSHGHARRTLNALASPT